MRSIAIVLVMVGAVLAGDTAYSHPGATNADGCHTNRKTGEYHCHNPKPRVPGTVTYCHVIKGENRCGYALGTCSDLVSKFGGSCKPQ
ncbi:MAG TPA: YHYH domain-containing protein [Gammaproteobacteria bacterium]|nr:YHYH domain-containing protein [Gammaproteobacteria bacterium]